jgi:hypothetical protein
MGLFDFFKSKPTTRSIAEVLVDGRAAGQQELSKARYNT